MQKKIYALKILVLQWNTIVGKSKHLKVWCRQYHTSGETECQNFNLNELHCLRHICTISNHIQQWVMLTLMMMTMICSCAQKKGWASATTGTKRTLSGTSARAAFRHQTPYLISFVYPRYNMQTYSATCSKTVSNELAKLRRCVCFCCSCFP